MGNPLTTWTLNTDFEWVSLGRTAGEPEVPPALLQNDFSGYSVANPAPKSVWESMLQDPNAGNNITMRAMCEIVNLGGAHTNVIRWNAPAGSTQGPRFFSPTPMAARAMAFEYDFRIAPGGQFGGGFKMPGLGGNNAKLTNPPTGGSPSKHGFSARMMGLKDAFGGNLSTNDEITGYAYLPLQTTTNPSPLHTNVGLGTSDNLTSNGDWHHIRQEIELNDATGDSDNPNPVAGVDYLLNGVHRIFVDGVEKYTQTNRVWAVYDDVPINKVVWAQFYGGDATWAPTASGTKHDIDNVLLELL